MLTYKEVEVTWDQLSNVTGYLTSCTSSASYAGGKSVKLDSADTTSYTFDDLIENTPYDFSVQGLTRDGRKSEHSNKKSITTKEAGECYIIKLSYHTMYVKLTLHSS